MNYGLLSGVRVNLQLPSDFYYLQEQGIAVLSKAIEACTAEIELQKGKLTVKEAPRVVSIALCFLYAELHVYLNCASVF